MTSRSSKESLGGLIDCRVVSDQGPDAECDAIPEIVTDRRALSAMRRPRPSKRRQPSQPSLLTRLDVPWQGLRLSQPLDQASLPVQPLAPPLTLPQLRYPLLQPLCWIRSPFPRHSSISRRVTTLPGLDMGRYFARCLLPRVGMKRDQARELLSWGPRTSHSGTFGLFCPSEVLCMVC